MKLKHLTLLTALAGLLLATASCAKDDDPMAGKVPVTFIAHLPETIESRAIGDGSKANELFFWVYDENMREYVELRQANLQFDKTNTSTVTANLTPGHVYKFAFWAQRKSTTAYDPNNSDMVRVVYNPAECNDEMRDAFYGWIDDLTVTAEGQITREVVLTRKLTQLNIGISQRGAELARQAGVDLSEYDSEVTLTKNPAVIFNAFSLTKGIEESSVNTYKVRRVNFKKAPMPDELLNAERKKWVYLALNYFLTTVNEQSMVDVNLKLIHKTNGNVIELNFPNIPIKGNDRTNILIDALTEDVDFNVVIDDNFDNLDNNIFLDEQNVTTADELVSAMQNGGQFKLQNDITLTDGASLTIPQGKDVRLDLNGHTLANAVKAGPALLNQGTLTLLGGTIVNNNQEEQGADAVRNDGGTLTIMSGTYGSDNNRGAAVRNNGGTVTIDGGTFATIDRGLNKGYAYVFINNAADAVMTINNATSDCDPNGMFAANAGTITVNGGSYTMGDPNKPTYYLFYAEQGTININAGTYNWTHGTSANVYQYIDGNGTINIADGVTINATYK